MAHDQFNDLKYTDKIQRSFLIKDLCKLVVEGNILDMIKAIYEKSVTATSLKGERLKTITLRTNNDINWHNFY